jgi:hypothetical protein
LLLIEDFGLERSVLNQEQGVNENWKENLDARNEVIWRNSKLGSLFTKRKVNTILEVDDYGVESEH